MGRFRSFLRLLHHVATIRAQDLTSHVCSFVGGEIEMRIGNILGRAKLAHRNTAQEKLFHLFSFGT